MRFSKELFLSIFILLFRLYLIDACQINICELPMDNICDGKQCRMHQSCLRYECYCDITSTHPSCRNSTVDCPCVHGYCNATDDNVTECVCDPGYHGVNCSEVECLADLCEGECPGQDCKILDDCSIDCYCDNNSTKCNVTSNTSLEHDPCYIKNVTYRPITERQCDDNMTCEYGRCVSENNSSMCECDDGHYGSYCEQKCCLDCGEHGECRYRDFLGEYCHCFDNFSGDNCEITLPQYNREYNPCYANFTGRTWIERACYGGLFCTYGSCVNEGTTYWCRCDSGADGHLCEQKCCLDCGPHGECRNTLSGEICNCYNNYTGSRCEKLKPKSDGPAEEVTWYWWVVGFCALVFVILLSLLVALPYVLWKHRNIVVMKLVYFFQKYEDDDEREWDAFVSYRSLPWDESFVVHTLFPKLEQELGFKLHLHFRDFLPGDTVANNIINAVKGSRRTILILTPGYLQSEHTLFEFHIAQQAMLERKHRIIPVILEDITNFKSSMDPNLKTVLSSITYLEWPQESIGFDKKVEKFWKRLQLSLPKKRLSSDSSEISSSASIATDSTAISKESMKANLTNDFTYSNKGYYNNPEDDYDIINETELDINRKIINTHETNEVTDADRYMKILDV